jgi:hypothetical protein
MTVHCVLEEWKKLAAIENRRMRETMDGRPWGEPAPTGPKPKNGVRMTDRIVQLLRQNGPMTRTAIADALRIPENQLTNALHSLGRSRRARGRQQIHNVWVYSLTEGSQQ